MAGNTARPVVLSSLRRPSDGEDAPAAGSGGGFVQAVAGAWEAGLAVSFAGLFAGETRRRISLPDYPFERRRHWMKKAERPAAAPRLGRCSHYQVKKRTRFEWRSAKQVGRISEA